MRRAKRILGCKAFYRSKLTYSTTFKSEEYIANTALTDNVQIKCASFLENLTNTVNNLPKNASTPKLEALVEEFKVQEHVFIFSFFEQLNNKYKKATLPSYKSFVKNLPASNPCDIFTNLELRLDSLEVFGFDYDYTLASYTQQLETFIYDKAAQYMVNEMKYPVGMKALTYKPGFAIRGLHFDQKHGNLLKMDYLNMVQADSVYKGRVPLNREELEKKYPSGSIPSKYAIKHLRRLSDIFCLPEACLISDTIQYMVDQKIPFDANYVLSDVTRAVGYVHSSGKLYSEVVKNMPLYLNRHQAVVEFLLRLKDHGKKLFLLTNSPFYFVNTGMEYLTQGFLPKKMENWRDIFDVIFTSCNKPQFFVGTRPFRKMTPEGAVKWDACVEFRKDEIYMEGSLRQMVRLTGWKGSNVLYFGDHLSNDVKEPSLAGWQTGVIIAELETEVNLQNSEAYRTILAELLEIDRLSSAFMHLEGESIQKIVTLIKQHRDFLRYELKRMFNPHFGSVFRTHKNATSFAYEVQRYANVYTSKVDNFLNYPLSYTFYPERVYLPHEPKIPAPSILSFK